MSMMDGGAPAPSPAQGTAGGTDVVTALQGITRQITNGNKQLADILAAITALNFPQNVKGYTVATLPSSPSIGAMAYVTNGTAALAWGATVTGTGSAVYLVWWNGANWTVVGK